MKAQVRMALKRNRVEKPEEVGASWTVPYRAWLGPPKLKPAAQVCLSSLLRKAKALDEEIMILDRQLIELSQEERCREPAQALFAIGGGGVAESVGVPHRSCEIAQKSRWGTIVFPLVETTDQELALPQRLGNWVCRREMAGMIG